MLNFIKNYHILREKIFFTIAELNELDINNSLIKILEEELILRNLFEDIYTLNDNTIRLDLESGMILTKKIDNNSYISGETALEKHWVIYWPSSIFEFASSTEKTFEWDFLTISSLKKSTKKIDTDELIIYVSNKWVTRAQTPISIKIATIEQAIVDRFYNNKLNKINFNAENFFAKHKLLEKVNIKKLIEKAHSTNDIKTIKLVEDFIKWFTN